MSPMHHLPPHKAGLALGGVFAVFHFLWALLVLLGWAQAILDWIFRLHFIQPPFLVSSFSLLLALELIIVTFVIGYGLGWIFAQVWNGLHRSR